MGHEDILEYYLKRKEIGYLLVVEHRHDGFSEAFLYARQGCGWTAIERQDAFTGRNGIGKTGEGDGRTPSGELLVTGAFGIMPNPGTSLQYIEVKEDTIACDEDCEYYNRIVRRSETSQDVKGEEMFRLDPEYRYGMTTDYNRENKYPAGSAIFIHCKGNKSYTGGCIAFAEDFVVRLLRYAGDGLAVFVR